MSFKTNYSIGGDGSRHSEASVERYEAPGESDFARQMRERREAYEMYESRPRAAGPRVAAAPPPPVVNQPTERGGSPMAKMLEQQQQLAQLRKLQVMQSGPPMKAATGFNQIGGAAGRDVMDVAAMDGYERQAYLPQGSQFENNGLSLSEMKQLSPKAQAAAVGNDGDDFSARWNALPLALRRAILEGKAVMPGGQ
jgi:hypothetical protein